MKFKKVLWTALGCVGLGLGAVGVVVHPSAVVSLFVVGTGWLCGEASEKLHRWCFNTRLYKNNLESYVQGRGMTWRTKRRIILTVTLLMAFGFAMMLRKELYVPCAILAGVWVFHLLYFAIAGQNAAGAGIGRRRCPLRHLLWPWELREVLHRGSAGVVLAKMVPVQLGGADHFCCGPQHF